MKVRRRTSLTITRRQVTTFPPATVARCERCAADAELVTPEVAAARLGTTPRVVYRRAESGELHFVETPAGGLLICCGPPAPRPAED